MIAYAPPHEIFRRLKERGVLQSAAEIPLYINICSGIIRWALNDASLFESGVRWVYSVFSIQELTPHSFYWYEIDGIRASSRFSTLEWDSSRFKQQVPTQAYDDIKKAMAHLEAQGVISHTDPLHVTPERIMSVLAVFADYILEGGEVFNGKAVPDIYRGIGVAEKSRLGVALRIPGPAASDYIDATRLTVVPVSTIQCIECGEELPCCRSTSRPVCRNCEDTALHAATISCEHPECGICQCQHYTGGIDMEFLEAPMDWYDRYYDESRRYQDDSRTSGSPLSP